MKRQATYKLLTVALCSALLIVGCQKDDKDKVSVKLPSSGILSFGISQNDSWSSPSTKAEGQPQTKGSSFRSEMLLMDCEDPDSPLGDVYIYMTEEEIAPEQDPQPAPATRADANAPAEGEGSAPAEGGSTAPVVEGAYGVFAYQGTGDVPTAYTAGEGVSPFHDIQNLSLNSDGTYEGQNKGKEIYAPGAGTWLYFFAYGPHMEVAADDNTTANPALRDGSTYPHIEYTATQDLAKTTDLTFGGSAAPQSGEVNEPVALSVSHILSKVRINSSALAGTITSIKIKGIKDSGVYNDENSGNWDLESTTKDYVFLSIDSDGNLTSTDGYFLIPQTFAQKAELEIIVKVSSPDPTSETDRENTYVLTKKLSAISGSWSANKQYTYTITTPHEVQVIVSDDIKRNAEGQPVKENLDIRNNGLSPAYIRATIVGNWVLPNATETFSDDFIVAEWKPEEDGTFVWGADNGNHEHSSSATTGWYKHTDGYYYHLNPVLPGDSTAKLFDSYTLEVKAPVANAVLDMTIIVQAVYPADVQIVWPAEVTQKFVNTAFISE